MGFPEMAETESPCALVADLSPYVDACKGGSDDFSGR